MKHPSKPINAALLCFSMATLPFWQVLRFFNTAALEGPCKGGEGLNVV